jgi:hypothetical protein
MEAGKEIGGKQLQEIVWPFSSSIPSRIVVEGGIKENIKNKIYQQAVTDRASNLKQNWKIFEV